MGINFWPYMVEIPISPTQWESADWVSIKDKFVISAEDYLDERHLVQNIHFVYHFLKCCGPDGAHLMHFRFANINDALLFKLRFAGQNECTRS